MSAASEFAGRRCIVTGAASGIGDAVARSLLAAGAEVTSLDRNTPTAPVQRHIPVDLADRSSIDAALAELDGSYDALMNVAGIPGTQPADKVFAVNVLAARHIIEHVTGLLKPGGAIVVVGSSAGLGWPKRLDEITDFLRTTETYEEGAAWFAAHPQEGNAYNFSKEVITVYVMSLGLGMHGEGLRLNAVAPGPVQTPILADFRESMGAETIDAAEFMLGRHATPDDIVGPILFLASDAAAWVNGVNIYVDAGASGALNTGVIPEMDF